MNVQYFTVARDEYEGGNCPVCARCGANMRHVTVVDGKHYGNGCGKIMIEAMRSADSKREALIIEATKIMESARVNFYRKTTEEIRRSYNRTKENGSSSHKAWALLLEAKLLTIQE